MRIDTNNAEWSAGDTKGLEFMPLHEYKTEKVALIQIAPGVKLQTHQHVGGEEFFVLSGSITDENGHYSTGTWVRYPDGSAHAPYSDEGCKLFFKTGHL